MEFFRTNGDIDCVGETLWLWTKYNLILMVFTVFVGHQQLIDLLLITFEEILILEDKIMMLEQCPISLSSIDWWRGTCSDDTLFLSSVEWGSSIHELDLWSEFQFIRAWYAPVSWRKDEIICDLKCNNGFLALPIFNKHKDESRLDLRSSTTLECICSISYSWSLSFLFNKWWSFVSYGSWWSPILSYFSTWTTFENEWVFPRVLPGDSFETRIFVLRLLLAVTLDRRPAWHSVPLLHHFRYPYALISHKDRCMPHVISMYHPGDPRQTAVSDWSKVILCLVALRFELRAEQHDH